MLLETFWSTADASTPADRACVYGNQGAWKGRVRVEVSVLSHENTTALHAFASQLPPWTTVATFTTFQKSFDF
jgi:hypothetical protein